MVRSDPAKMGLLLLLYQYSKIIINATVGRRNIWFIIPTKKALGAYTRFVKSFIVKPRLRPSIINTKDRGRTISIIIIMHYLS